ncbi:CNP1-like family protein [Ramlibacter pallidus]|uniref:CNP1-like family protein n=1 Tax=Ramlibacter pallidus TaxID=2780087 RepID=A0ABR9S854_9BURK|nr:CNP1-like family protein [Ramlibacter pallidus]MBE7369686.1 CNP1-like family protein [Ramlibacter pallidus]
MHRRILALALACAAGAATAQFSTPDPDWKELETPPPPALRTQGLIALDIPGSSLRFGVDPGSIVVGTDGVVRYVVVATSPSGTVNGMYEGIRCSSGEVKVYARHNPDSGWVQVKNSDWQPLHGGTNFRYSLYLARNGVCVGHSNNGPAVQIVRDLKAPHDRRFERGGVNR